MTFSSFRLILSSLVLTGATLLAQATPTPGATPEPKEHKPKDGYIRFWNMLPKEAGDLSILRETGTGEPETFASAAPGNNYAAYLLVKPGRYGLQVVRAAEPKNILKTFDLVLKANVFVTFIARVVDRQLTIEMVDDTYDRETAIDGRLTIRHELPGATVTVAGGAREAKGLAYGQVERLEGFPTKPVTFKMTAILPNGQKRDWTMDVDFRSCRHVTLFLALDAYGRFRPRMSPEGQRDYSEAAPTP